MLSRVCTTIEQERSADADLQRKLIARMHKNIHGVGAKEKKELCAKHIRSKYFKIVMQSIYTLTHWLIDSKNYFTEIRIRADFTFDKIEYYFNKYQGNRFHRQLIYNFIFYYRKEYGNIFPSSSTLNYIFDAMIEFKLLHIENSELGYKIF